MSKIRISKDEAHSQVGENSNTSEDFDRDLHPNSQLEDITGLDDENMRETAYNNKDIVNAYPQLSNDELKRLIILPEGTALEQGSTYFDLKDRSRGEFTAANGNSAGQDNWYVAKSQVDYPLWNRLTGVDNPDRLDQPSGEALK
jgi:hypothetical protein